MELRNLTGSSFIAPDVVLDCTNVDSQISSMQENMMTIKLDEQGQKDYEAWLENAKRIQAECKASTSEPPVPLVKKPTTLQPVLVLLGLVVVGVVAYKLIKK